MDLVAVLATVASLSRWKAQFSHNSTEFWQNYSLLKFIVVYLVVPSPSIRQTDKMSGREIIQQPPDPTQQEDGEPIKQRTEQQQEKADNALKQQQREAGEQSNRSRSQSRRDRRKRIRQQQDDGKYMKTNSLEALEEADANQEMSAMQPFERIGPDSTSMDGPVTRARAMRGEIPVRGSNPNQPYYMTPEQPKEVC